MIKYVKWIHGRYCISGWERCMWTSPPESCRDPASETSSIWGRCAKLLCDASWVIPWLVLLELAELFGGSEVGDTNRWLLSHCHGVSLPDLEASLHYLSIRGGLKKSEDKRQCSSAGYPLIVQNRSRVFPTAFSCSHPQANMWDQREVLCYMRLPCQLSRHSRYRKCRTIAAFSKTFHQMLRSLKVGQPSLQVSWPVPFVPSR